MSKASSRKIPSISDNLSVAAIPIGVTYILVMLAVAIALYQAQSSQKNINNALAPLLSNIKNIVTDVTYVAAYVPRIQYAPDNAALNNLKNTIIPNLEQVQVDLNKISSNHLVTLDLSYKNELDATFDQLEINIVNLILLRKQRYQWQAEFNQLLTLARNTLEQNIINIETYINQNTLDKFSPRKQDAFLQMQLNLERIARHLNAIEILSSTDRLLAEKSALSLLFRETAELNIRTQENKFSRGFAKNMEEIFSHIMEKNGAIAKKRLLLENTKNLAVLSNQALLSTNIINEKTVKIASKADKTIAVATERSHLIITIVFFTIPIAFIITIALTALFIWRAVILGILKPLSQISHSTLALAEGNINTQIHQQDTEEFIVLAKSLETFKLNSIKLINKEKDLQEKNISLEKANEDLNHFAYIASHDLKSPLRGISNLAQFIQDDLDESRPEELESHLKKMHTRINRMNNLLDDLLEYSRIGIKISQTDQLDTKEILRECFEIVNENFAMTLNIETVPTTINIHRTPFMQVVRNLFDNAVKHHDRKQGMITVNCKESRTEYHFSIADDGPGIPHSYQERIFKIFHRLKSRDQVEGSGIGLSIVEKILHTYGGTIDVSSDPDNQRGTEFVLHWPKQSLPQNRPWR